MTVDVSYGQGSGLADKYPSTIKAIEYRGEGDPSVGIPAPSARIEMVAVVNDEIEEITLIADLGWPFGEWWDEDQLWAYVERG